MESVSLGGSTASQTMTYPRRLLFAQVLRREILGDPHIGSGVGRAAEVR